MNCIKWAALAVLGIVLPNLAGAQNVPSEIKGLHKVLDDLYKETLPMCTDLISIGSALAGFAATFYIGSRIWKSIASAEPIDFYPLFRPFVLGFCVMNFQMVIALINGILQPTVDVTNKLVNNTNESISKLLAKRQQMMDTTRLHQMYGVNNGEGNRDLWLKYTHEDEVGDEDWFGIGNDIEFAMSKYYYNLKAGFKEALSYLLQIVYEAAALCINTLRTFNLLICAILGPIVFGLAVFDGFTHTLTVYLSKYINFYLWLPIANILGSLLGKIQEGMIKLDMLQIGATGDTFLSASDAGYLIFMIIGIVSYTTVPNMANLIVNTGQGSAITDKITGMAKGAVGMGAGAVTGGATMGVGMAADGLGDVNLMMTKGTSGSGVASDYFNDKLSG